MDGAGMNTEGGVSTTYERGWGHAIPGFVLGAIGVAIVLVLVRNWVAGIFADVGPIRSADITMLLGGGSLCVGAVALFVFVVVGYIYTRLAKHAQAPIFPGFALPQAQAQGGRSLMRPDASLRTGNLYSLAPSVLSNPLTVHFKDETSQVVTVDAAVDFFEMPRAVRTPETWKHDKAHYTVLNRFAQEVGALGAKGSWNEPIRRAILADVMAKR